jgi:hypothetical protein
MVEGFTIGLADDWLHEQTEKKEPRMTTPRYLV